MSEWIDALKKQPEVGEEVLINTHDHGIIVGSFYGDGWISGNQFVSWDYSYNHGVDVTHWMPLPEPPKK